MVTASKPRGPSEVLALWERRGYRFSREVIDSFEAYEPTILYRCSGCGFEMFLPTWAASTAFYDTLSARSDTYYLGEKWEYAWAVSGVGPGERVLDVGCGAGRFLELVRGCGATGVGVETAPSARAQATSRGFECYDVDVVKASAVADHDFDIVCAFQVLEHAPDPVAFTKALADCARPGGAIFIAVPNAGGSLRWLVDPVADIPPHHLSRWRASALEALASRVGLQMMRLEYEPLDIIHHADHLAGWWRNAVLHGWGTHDRFNTPSGFMQRAGSRSILTAVKAANRVGVRSISWIHGHTVAAVMRKPG